MTRFTVILFGCRATEKRKEGGALHLCDREGLDHVTSFLTRASGGVTPYCIRIRKSGKAERGAGERGEVVANEERESWDGARTW
jgi:hypothetical protein